VCKSHTKWRRRSETTRPTTQYYTMADERLFKQCLFLINVPVRRLVCVITDIRATAARIRRLRSFCFSSSNYQVSAGPGGCNTLPPSFTTPKNKPLNIFSFKKAKNRQPCVNNNNFLWWNLLAGQKAVYTD
jgi:hypothetical protein